MSANESDSLWQVKDYKAFAPYVDWDNVDFTTMPAIQVSVGDAWWVPRCDCEYETARQ